MNKLDILRESPAAKQLMKQIQLYTEEMTDLLKKSSKKPNDPVLLGEMRLMAKQADAALKRYMNLLSGKEPMKTARHMRVTRAATTSS